LTSNSWNEMTFGSNSKKVSREIFRLLLEDDEFLSQQIFIEMIEWDEEQKSESRHVKLSVKKHFKKR
jgi:hypothetical protein